MPFCTNCGEEYELGKKFCSNCGAKLDDGKAFIPNRKDGEFVTLRTPVVLNKEDRTFEIASYGDRFLGFFIDNLVIIILVFFTFFISVYVGELVTNILSITESFGYLIFLEGAKGQTIGKMIVHTKVIKEDGSKCDLSAAFIRNILRIIDFLPMYYLVGLIFMARSEKSQRLGDSVAKTIVVKVK